MSWEPKIRKGSLYLRELRHKNPNGTAVDDTGKEVRITLAGLFSAPLVLATNVAPTALGSSLTWTDEDSGVFELRVSAAESATMTSQTGTWLMEYHDGVEWRDIGSGMAYSSN